MSEHDRVAPTPELDSYHTPPPTPREEMWEQIRARIGTERAVVVPLPSPSASPWASRRGIRIGVGAAAAMIAIGFALGRFTRPRAVAPVADVAVASESLFRAAAADHLTRSEELLTLVRSDARAGRLEPAVGAWGEGLLAQTRLLMDSPAGADPELRPLLEDLELILAQIALLGGGVGETRGREELRLIAEGMDTQSMLPRIQAALPSLAGS